MKRKEHIIPSGDICTKYIIPVLRKDVQKTQNSLKAELIVSLGSND